MKITELREKQQKLVADARALREEITDATTEARATEIDAAHDAAMAEYDRIEARIKRIEEAEERERALNEADVRRPHGENRQTPAAGGNEDAATLRAAAFRSYLRVGLEEMPAEQRAIMREIRAQGVGTDAKGGFLVPEGFMAGLVTSLKAWGPMLDPGITRRLDTATGNSIPWPTMDDTSNKGALIAENTQVTPTDITFSSKTLGAYKYTSGVVLVSSELLQDSALDLEAIVRAAMAERIGRIGNEHLTVGDGNGKPNGIVTASGSVAAATAAAVTFDDFIELQHGVDPAYRDDPSARYMFNDKTLKATRKLKDGEGRYIWQPADVKSGLPSTILDKPFSVNQDMADIGASAKSVTFGAMNRYVVRMVKEFAIRRLVERYADYDQTGFIGFTRFDGELLDAGAVKSLAHPAS